MKPCRRQISFTKTSSEEDIDESKLRDDDEMDDMEESKALEKCLVCGEFGGTEIWFRCKVCGMWAHADCSGFDTADNYKCDY